MPQAKLNNHQINQLELNEEYRQVLAESQALDALSNQVLERIELGKFNEAEEICRQLREEYPDQVDGLERLAFLHESRGHFALAAEYYRQAHAFMLTHDGFDDEIIEYTMGRVFAMLKAGMAKI